MPPPPISAPTTEPRLRTRVVVAEPFSPSGVAVLEAAGIEVVSQVGGSRAELADAIAEADGLIVRSETRVDRELLARASKLQVVARAGVGVDAIDVPAATEAGILVLNTPAANTLAAIEQTFALTLALARHTVRANASILADRWERTPFIGTELAGKTLGIVGLGRIGGGVATRAAAFGMTLLASDPFISQQRADALDVELVPLADLLGRADVVTLHTPLSTQTRGLIGAAELALMRPTALLVNCARGGIVDEPALLVALDAGTIRAAAIDVVAHEPPQAGDPGSRLQRHPKVLATPHLGGSTVEALERIATELARDVASVLGGGPAAGAVNAPIPDGPEAERLRPFVDLAHRLGRLYPQLAAERNLRPFEIVLEGQIAPLDAEPLVTAFLSGLLQTTTDRRVSIVNARAIAAELGITVAARGDDRPSSFLSTLRITGGDTTLVGTVAYGGPRLVSVDGFEVESIPSGPLLVTLHHDVPGIIGRVGTILGNAGINISAMSVSRRDAAGSAVMILATDTPVPSDVVAAVRVMAGMRSVRAVGL